MKTRFSFIDPSAIIGVVVALIILGVGVFAFFITAQTIQNQIPINYDYNGSRGINQTVPFNYQMNNTSTVGGQVFNILGVVLIIGAIMAIVGLVYNYVR